MKTSNGQAHDGYAGLGEEDRAKLSDLGEKLKKASTFSVETGGQYFNIKDAVKVVSRKLEQAAKEKRDVLFYDEFGPAEREAVKVLAQAGDVRFYKKRGGDLLVKYKKPGFVRVLCPW